MYQQTEQIQEDCQFAWVKFCAQEPIQEILLVDVDLMLTCKSYVVALSVHAHGLFTLTCIFTYQAHLKRKLKQYIYIIQNSVEPRSGG
jgi:hypothetical protein